MTLKALDIVGGTNYLVSQAKENPVAFLTLLGKMIPRQQVYSGKIQVDQTLIIKDSRQWLEEQIRTLIVSNHKEKVIDQDVIQIEHTEAITLDPPANVVELNGAVSMSIKIDDARQAETAEDAATLAVE